MRLVDLRKTSAYLALYKKLPKLNSLVSYIACVKFKGYSPSIKESLFLAIGFTLLCVTVAIGQTILSLYFWEWFGLNRMTAIYLISLGVMLVVFTLITMVSIYVRGMSAKIDNSLSKSKYFTVFCFVMVFMVFAFYKADDYAMIMTIELIAVIVGLGSIFVEQDFDSSKIESEQFKELLDVRAFNLQLMKLKSRINKNDIETNNQINELYKNSSKIEAELTRYFSD
jgi:hypothetical protein